MMKDETIGKILELEVEMFLAVPTDEEPPCRSDIENMRIHRSGQLSSWSEDACSSYLEDLRSARDKGINLMTIKYARMGKQIPPYSLNPRIDQIVDIYRQWQAEVLQRYPNVMSGGRDIDDFQVYLRSELETYSDRTLEILWTDVRGSREAGRNMSADVYKHLAGRAGYQSLEDMEKSLMKRYS